MWKASRWVRCNVAQEEELEKLRTLSEQNQKLMEQNEQYRQVTIDCYSFFNIKLDFMTTAFSLPVRLTLWANGNLSENRPVKTAESSVH